MGIEIGGGGVSLLHMHIKKSKKSMKMKTESEKFHAQSHRKKPKTMDLFSLKKRDDDHVSLLMCMGGWRRA